VPKVITPLWLVLVIFFTGGLIAGLLQRGKNKQQQRAPGAVELRMPLWRQVILIVG
jgi:hypothetical protein